MKVSRKEFIKTITVICFEHEREATKDWLSNQGYEPEPDVQYKSNEFLIKASIKTLIRFDNGSKVAESELQAAQEYINEFGHTLKAKNDELYIPKIIQTGILDYPLAVEFCTHEPSISVLVYILKKGYEFKAVGWSEST